MGTVQPFPEKWMMGNMTLGRPQQTTLMTAEQYLALEERSEVRHEFVDGVVYAVVGARFSHSLIVGNTLALLHGKLPERCRVVANDFKVHIETSRTERFYYPDVVVICAELEMKAVFCTEPQVVVEVLSPSTSRTNRIEKLDAYRQLPSLQEYVLVHHDAPAVELFRREREWAREVCRATEVLELSSLGLAIDVDDLYRRVEFDSE
jgi:Uma2 family endonuclease